MEMTRNSRVLGEKGGTLNYGTILDKLYELGFSEQLYAISEMEENIIPKYFSSETMDVRLNFFYSSETGNPSDSEQPIFYMLALFSFNFVMMNQNENDVPLYNGEPKDLLFLGGVVQTATNHVIYQGFAASGENFHRKFDHALDYLSKNGVLLHGRIFTSLFSEYSELEQIDNSNQTEPNVVTSLISKWNSPHVLIVPSTEMYEVGLELESI